MVTRLPGTFGKASDEIGTEIPIGRAASAGVTAAAQSGSNRKESSSPIGEPGSQASAARTAPESTKRLDTVTSGWMNLRYAAPVIKLIALSSCRRTPPPKRWTLSCQHHSISSPATSVVAARSSVLTIICLPSRLKTGPYGRLVEPHNLISVRSMRERIRPHLDVYGARLGALSAFLK